MPSFDDLATPLSEVTFVVVDVETTGASPATCAITEVGALKYRGGKCLGTFHTLVNPGTPIPPLVTVLTGITEAMVMPAPPIRPVLPSLLEFAGGAVLVGHNLRFDIAFLDAALDAHGYPRLRPHRRVDTLGLARRLLRDEVPNLRLGTLARHLRVASVPIHRALEDARATAEVFHALLERAGTLGVLGLDDLLALPAIRAHPTATKLRLTARLPRRPGVYLFRDRAGRVLSVGKATNVRARVRSYFSGDGRRKVPQLLRETEAIDHLVCRHPLEAEVRELRLVREHAPRFNRQAKAWRSYAYLKLTLAERFPRLAVVRTPRADGGVYLGPVRSVATAHAVREAIETALPLRRCATRVGRRAVTAGPPCLPAQLGVAACPCRGYTGEADYLGVVDFAARGLRGEHELLIRPLEARIRALARDERFEEAAMMRDRLRALGRALRRQRLLDSACRAGRVVVGSDDDALEIVNGHLVLDGDAPESVGNVVPRDRIDEVLAVARWLEKRGLLVPGVRSSSPYEPRRAVARPAR